MLLLGCANGGFKPKPVPPCSSPLACAIGPKLVERPGCRSPKVEKQSFWIVGNQSADKFLRLYLRPTLRHINQGASDEYNLPWITRTIPPNTPTLDVRCRYVELRPDWQEYDEYYYTLERACFLDRDEVDLVCDFPSTSAPSTSTPIEAKPGDLPEGLLGKLRKAVNLLLTSPDPLTSLPIGDILSAWDPDRPPAEVKQGSFTSVGEQVDVAIEFSANDIDTASIRLPAVVKGKVQRTLTPGKESATLTFQAPSEAVQIAYFLNGKMQMTEYIRSIQIEKNKITFSGSARFRYVFNL
jgi:hypothetical protein